MKFGRVGILMGGCSSERMISLKSGQAVFDALKAEGLDVVACDIVVDDPEKIREQLRAANLDMAFIALHGRCGEDGFIQQICQDCSLSYVGSGVAASQKAFDKSLAQDLFKKEGINVADYVSLSKGHNYLYEDICRQCGEISALVIKPAREGSSIGISIVNEADTFKQALKAAFSLGDKVIVERFIEGRELTVGILGGQALPVIEICSNHSFFDFSAKYEKGATQYVVPAPLTLHQTQQIQAIALKAHQILGCDDFSRVDFILGEDQKFYVLEVNTIPGFTATSLLPKAAVVNGLNFSQLCLKLLELANGKEKEKN